ncbi:DUF4231 domain-containing protein [Streptomyces sp. NPDC092369]|uniref:DUF4231 domain-containing protein n=1 Tax=Streptomyces sp. NPDC092369 TaxID=3366015 RepID=UPI0038287A96
MTDSGDSKNRDGKSDFTEKKGGTESSTGLTIPSTPSTSFGSSGINITSSGSSLPLTVNPSTSFTYFPGGSNVQISHGLIRPVGFNNSTLTVNGVENKGLEQKKKALTDFRNQYLSELQDEIKTVGQRARGRLRWYRLLRLLILTSSAVTPVLALMKGPALITALVAAFAFICEGGIQLTRLHNRAVLDSQRATALGREYRMFRTEVGPYTGDNAFTLLVKAVEAFREESDSADLGVVEQTFSAASDRRQ